VGGLWLRPRRLGAPGAGQKRMPDYLSSLHPGKMVDTFRQTIGIEAEE